MTNPNRCPYCNAENGSGCGHGLGGNQGLIARIARLFAHR